MPSITCSESQHKRTSLKRETFAGNSEHWNLSKIGAWQSIDGGWRNQ